MIHFVSLASGSSGNCYYLSDGHTTILIDAGIGSRTIKKRLKELDLDFQNIQAVLVTHDHVDHIKAVGSLGEKSGIPIYSTRKVHSGISRSYCMTERLKTSAHFIEKEEPFMIGSLRITAFDVPHDSIDNAGYFIETTEGNFCLATDVGHLTESVIAYLCNADYLVLEANYDETMLRMGPYPTYLKERILSSTGHLSNREAAEFLVTHYSPRWRYVWLCHLSKDNNHPDLAYKTVEMRLGELGIRVGEDIQVIPLRRSLPTGIFHLGTAGNSVSSVATDMDLLPVEEKR